MSNKLRKQAFSALKKQAERLAGTSLHDMFAADPERFARFSARCDDILLDYSKNRIDEEAFALLLALAEEFGVEERRDAMWAGQSINTTEDRAVLHMALRYFGDEQVQVAGRDVTGDVRAVLANIRDFSTAVREGSFRGWGGWQFTDVVNIGIGGSDLGPAMVTQALEPYTRPDLRVHYVSNVDGAHLADTLKYLEPRKTLFIVASKTFTTDETMTNADSARRWIASALGEEAVATHFVAVSTNLDACADFGIAPERIFGFWDWVGGRYSVWSAIGLPVAIAIGYDNFEAFLRGAGAMDAHFRDTPLQRNLPVILALLGVFYRNGWNYPTHAILPYDQRLARLPAYLQQLDMESNGKGVTLKGKSVAWNTGAIVWGEPGTNGQHAFYQLLHQGTSVVPCDFLVAALPHEDMPGHHERLLANCLAQSEALMLGRTRDEVLSDLKGLGMTKEEIKALAPHKVFPGNRPSTTLLYARLDPATLGKLIALYEHKVFVEGVIWGINSFDQWGVQLGKQLASALLPAVRQGQGGGHDSSTLGLLAHYHNLRG